MDPLSEWLARAEATSYYDLLGAKRGATQVEIKTAFHAFALRYHPDRFSGEEAETQRLVAEVFKRGVEAYRVLSRPKSRAEYDKVLAAGVVRAEHAARKKPPPPPVRTLEMIAKTAQAKKHAQKAERFLSIGKLEEARVSLVSACQCEPDNAELADRLSLVYEALALEPM